MPQNEFFLKKKKMPFNAIHGKYLTGNFAEMLFQVVFDRAKRR